jgi:restriction system protein
VQCLHRLKAIISHHPYALEPIEPVGVFDLTTFAFVEGLDAVQPSTPGRICWT